MPRSDAAECRAAKRDTTSLVAVAAHAGGGACGVKCQCVPRGQRRCLSSVHGGDAVVARSTEDATQRPG